MDEENTFLNLVNDEQELYLEIKHDIISKESVSIEDIQNQYGIGYAEAHKMYDLLVNENILGELDNGRRKVNKFN